MERQRCGIKNGVATCIQPNDPIALYVLPMYHEYFYGPFADEAALVSGLKKLDTAAPYWDYDCFAITKGDPTVTDYSKLPYVTGPDRARIEAARSHV